MLRGTLDLDRRDLAKSAVLGAAMAVALPLAGNAQTPDPDENLVFTEGDPGHWADKAALHVPLVTVVGNTLTVKTPHSMSEAHYIVSHTVVLAGGVFLSRKTFTYMDTPVSEHILPPGYKGKVTCTSTCNLHDFWVKTLSV